MSITTMVLALGVNFTVQFCIFAAAPSDNWFVSIVAFLVAFACSIAVLSAGDLK